MIVSLAEMKTYLGLAGTDQDNFLTEQLILIQEAVEGYCNRKFEEATYVQSFYPGDLVSHNRVILYHYPVSAISTIDLDSASVSTDTRRLHKSSGTLFFRDWYGVNDLLEIEYVAGYAPADMPPIIKTVIKNLVEERYNKKSSGVSLNFGSDVQRVSIPGTLSIDFDYSLQSNERTSKFGNILGSNVNLLTHYRSERSVIGSQIYSYVEKLP